MTPTKTEQTRPDTLDTRKAHSALAGFHPATREWFAASFASPTRAQELGWPAIATGGHTLILAPTGSGKTLAAFLTAIDHLMFAPVPQKEKRCRVLYISPLKALAVDVERNLRAPLVGVLRYAERQGITSNEPIVAIRTGDTPSRERAQFNRNPSDILITTPESLYLLLTSNARETLRSVRWVIIDEIHAMVGTKRGTHLALSLERLQEIADNPFQRIGLSATQRPLDEVARFLGGFEETPLTNEVWRPTEGLTDVPAPVPLLSKERLGEVPTSSNPPPVLKEGLGEVPNHEITPLIPPLSTGGRLRGDFLTTEWDDPESAYLEDNGGLTSPPLPFLGEGAGGVRATSPRPVNIVDAGSSKTLDLRVEVPVEDMAKLGEVQEIPSGPAAQGDTRTSIWPAIHPMILKLIKEHRSTLIFVNSRRLAERLAGALNELAGEEIVHAHHGSIAREQRTLIEDALKSGRLPAMVATSSLELGIDMGAIDLVIQVEAPPSVASAIQRIGRAGHQVGVPSKGIIIPKYRGDLLACAALTERMDQGAVEQMRYPRNPLDILAQQLVAMVSMDDWRVMDIERVIRHAAPFAELPHSMFEETLDMLSGRYPSDDFAELRPRITWDRLNGMLHSREGAKRIAISNGGTIPDRGLYGVFLLGAEKGRGRVGELDEEMVFESRVGETFMLGASSWRIEEITHDRVVVSPAPGVPGKMPFWHGESAGRPLEFGRAIGALSRTLRELPPEQATHLLTTRHSLDIGAARNLMQYLNDQVAAAGAIPDDRTLVVESYRDELGDWRVCILSPFGSKVHAPWAMAIGAMVAQSSDAEIDVLWTDDGIVARFPEADEPPNLDAVIPDPDEVEELVIRQLGTGRGARAAAMGAPPNALFASRFREAASRALLLPRRHPGQRAPLWQQRKRSAELLGVTAKFGSFPIILETYRECLRDVFDMPALVGLLRDIRDRQIRVVPVQTRAPSPFAAALMFNYVANFIYEGDAPLAERRAQALAVDPAQLRELLGEVELRDLLDANALEALELYLAHLTPERAVRHADGLHDLLIRLGDLSHSDVMARVTSREDAAQWIARLEHERRIITLTIAGEPRYVAAEDAGRYRDALGIPPPPGLPMAFLEYIQDPLGDLVTRYARTHGPFKTEDIARRFGIGVGPIATVLAQMASAGRVVEGDFRPGATGREWCDSGVLRALRQKSLARLRHEVEPVEQDALARLYIAWQRVDKPGRGHQALLDAIEQLQGVAIPASLLETQILPARITDYDPHTLDLLTSSGQVLWTGCETLGQHDGRISLYLSEHAALLGAGAPRTTVDPASQSDLHATIRQHLASRGASFYPQVLQATGGFPPEVLQALWDLVWAGEVTNDTIQPLRAFLSPRSSSRASEGRHRARETAPRRWRSARTNLGIERTPPASLSSMSRNMKPEASGRWSLVSSLVYGETTLTERLSAQAHQLLDRYGVLTREAVQAEGIDGGFSAVYGILKAMEEVGQVRRGYFVAGLGATQFALPGAVDRLRTLREPGDTMQGIILAATDPANPYGAALKWPESTGGRKPMRMAAANVVLIDGALAAWMGRGERQLVTFLESVPERALDEAAYEVARLLAASVTSGQRRSVFIEEVDGKPAYETPMGPALLEAGFSQSMKGYLKRG